MCIVEKRRVEGRNQEWNVSGHELQVRQTLRCDGPLQIQGLSDTP